MEALSKNNQNPAPFVSVLLALASATDETQVRDLRRDFYVRVNKAFYTMCRKAIGKIHPGHPECDMMADDLFQDCIITAFEKIGSFRTKPEWGDPECTKVLLFWLGKIANTKLMNEARDRKKIEAERNDYIEYQLSEAASGQVFRKEYAPTYEKEKFDNMWAKLSEMNKEIILLCAKHGTLEENNTIHLPDDAIEHLTKKHKVTPAAIRKAKQRTLEALKACKINAQ